MRSFYHYLFCWSVARPGAAAKAAGALLLALVPLLAHAQSLTITGTGTGSPSADVTAFVDQVEVINSATGAVVNSAVANASFETPAQASGGFTYNPTGAGWTFGSNAGVARPGGGFKPPSSVPDGSQVAFVQTNGDGTGTLTQTLTLGVGTYRVRFQAGQRNLNSANQGLTVAINGVVVLSTGAVPNNSAYTPYTSAAFTVVPPTLTASSPASGLVGGLVTLTGTNLTGTTAITFSGASNNVVTAGFTANAAGTQLTDIVVPSGATTGPLTVTTPGGTSTSVSFTVLGCPSGSRLYVNGANATPGAGDTWATAQTSLAEALQQARLCAAVKEIWVARGTYKPSRDMNYHLNPTDPRERTFRLVDGVRVYGGFAGTEVALSERTSANPTMLSGDFAGNDMVSGSGNTLSIAGNGEDAYHVLLGLDIANGAGTVLDGVSVRGGNTNGSGSSYANTGGHVLQFGAGIYITNGAPVLSNCIFVANTASEGGGIYCEFGALPTLIGCTISSNLSQNWGGGMRIFGGGAVLTNCAFIGNRSLWLGGGLYNEGTATLTGCILSDNSSKDSGGGIYNGISSGSLQLVNCVLANNSSGGYGGGGLYARGSRTDLANCTVTGNSTSYYGGGGILFDNAYGTVRNCIIWNNTGGSVGQQNIYDVGSNNSYTTLAVSYCTVGDFPSPAPTNYTSSNISTTDPQFVNATDPDGADNIFGTTDDGLALQATSPALNASDPATTTPTLDLTGYLRTGIFDQGAYEYESLTTLTRLYVNAANATPGLGDRWATALTSLGEAVWLAHQHSNITEIWVAQGIYLPTRTPDGTAAAAGRDNTFYLPNGLKVYGGFVGTETTLTGRTAGHATILSGDFNGDDVVSGSGSTLSLTNNGENAYHVVLSVSATAATLLDNVSIRGGNANGNSSLSVAGKITFQNYGGGLFNASSSPTLTNCTLAGNSALLGGGLFNASSSPTLTNCSFSGNSTSNNGGGLYNASSSSPTLTNCTLSGNSASRYGGGLYYEYNAGGTVQNCIVYNNTGGPVNRQNIYQNGTSTALAVRYTTVGDYLATATNNYTATNVSAADPQFVNASDPDGADNMFGTADDGLALTATSPAINAGDPATTSPTTDITGATRMGLLDQGAYEFTQLALLSVSPAQGTRLTLAGVNLQGATQVTFSGSSNNVSSGFTVNATGSQLTGVLVPSGAQTGPLTVTTPLGTSNSVPFTVCRITATAQNASQQLSAANTATFQAGDFFSAAPASTCGGVTVTALKAVASGSRSTSTSEGQTLTLPAPPAGAMFTGVTFASYGNPTGSSGAYTLGTCHAASSQSVVEGFVLGQSGAVSIPVTNDTFGGDPCGGTAKQLAVTATYTYGTPAASLVYDCTEQGTHSVLLTVTDGQGNTASRVATVTVLAPPLATLSSLSPAAAPVGTTVTVNGTNLDGVTTLTLNGTSAPLLTSSATALTFTVPAGATSGDIVLALPCRQPLSSPFAVQTTAPVLTSPTSGTTTNGLPTYAGTAPAGSTVTVYVAAGGGAAQPVGTTSASGGTFSLSPTTALASGSYSAYATAQTNGLDPSAPSAATPFTVDATAPTLGLSSAAGASGSNASTTPFTFTAIFSEPVSGLAASGISVTNGTVGNFASSSATTYTFTVTPTTPGTETTVTIGANAAQDAVGNGNAPAAPYRLTYVPPCAAPTAVAVGVLSATTASVRFTGSSTATGGYTLTYTPTGGVAQTVTTSTSPASLTGLTPNTTYALTVTSTCAGGQTASATPALRFTTPCEAPVLGTLPNLTLAAEVGQCSARGAFAGSATGAPTPTIAYTVSGQAISSPYVFAVGTTTVTATASSCGGTATQTFTVTVQDKQAPTVRTQPVTVALVNGTATLTAAQVNNGSSDNCSGALTYRVSPSTFNCANLGPNTVTLTVTDASGNQATQTATVTVTGTIPAPTISVTPATTTYTGGVATTLYLGYGPPSATLTASGGSTYQWSGPAGLSKTTVATPVFTATTAGTFTYTVTATSASGCTATKSVTLTVVDARCSSNGRKLDKVLVCHNGSLLCLDATGVADHLGHGDPLGACLSSKTPVASLALAVAAPSAASEARASLEAYPNPFTRTTTLRLRAAQAGVGQLQVYNVLGQLVATLYDGPLPGGEVLERTLDGTDLSSGLYTCRFTTAGQTLTQRLVLSR